VLLHRAGIQALCFDIAVDELDHPNRRRIAMTEARLEDPGVTALAILVARRQHIEELLDDNLVLKLRDGLAARMQIPTLAEGDELLDDRT